MQIPLTILKNKKLKIKRFIYPSTTNIDYNQNSIYSKIKLIAENKLKKIKKIVRYLDLVKFTPKIQFHYMIVKL